MFSMRKSVPDTEPSSVLKAAPKARKKRGKPKKAAPPGGKRPRVVRTLRKRKHETPEEFLGRQHVAQLYPKNIDPNRVYYHSRTAAPIQEKEEVADSEDEANPEFFQIKLETQVEDLSDVNEGEKEMMLIWNKHILSNPGKYRGAKGMKFAVQDFVNCCGAREVITKNLYKNFLLHLTNLHAHGVLSPLQMYQASCKVQELMREPDLLPFVPESYKESLMEDSKPVFRLKRKEPRVLVKRKGRKRKPKRKAKALGKGSPVPLASP